MSNSQKKIQSSQKVNTNIDDYSIEEMLTILGLNHEAPNDEEIISATKQHIQRFQDENNPEMADFFQKMQQHLIEYMQDLDEGYDAADDTDAGKQTETWWKNQALQQNDQVQRDKVTDRVQKVDIYENQHVPMKREQLGVSNTFQVPVAQDSLNPNLKNTTSRIIIFDSQFRQASGGAEAMSTDYTADLSEPITNALSLRLYSIQIPYTWYTIDYNLGNTCMWVTNDGTTFIITIEPGNYKKPEFEIAMNEAFFNAGFRDSSDPHSTDPLTVTPLSIKPTNGKVTIDLEGYLDPNGNAIAGLNAGEVATDTTPYLTFFDFKRILRCAGDGSCLPQETTFDSCLGWIMGYRLPVIPILAKGNVATAAIDLYGPKYFILVLDDYNQNHINNGLITITELPSRLDLPKYYTPDQPINCSRGSGNITSANPVIPFNITPDEALALGINPDNIGNIIMDKVNFSYKDIPTVLPSAPRTLTQAQIYTINEIYKGREKTINYRGRAPNNSDTFAIIPLKREGFATGELYVEFSGGLQDNKRIYFGPVDIDRLHIKLLDDRGNIVNLHGLDWCFTVISENLYQY
uniref:Uncharacterized protein n=1 Tax=viral metagenome TaxID=1070528 RepID=A0A6C0F4P3_9ZZZZ